MGAISRQEIIRKFRALGFEGPFPGKRHSFMQKKSLKVRISNPHGGEEIDMGLVRRILRNAGISMDEWDKA